MIAYLALVLVSSALADDAPPATAPADPAIPPSPVEPPPVEPPPASPTSVEPPPKVDAPPKIDPAATTSAVATGEIAALEARIAALETALAARPPAPLVEPADDAALKFELKGYYRVRALLYSHVFAAQGEGDDYRDARLMTQRLRLAPQVAYKDLATFFMQVDALDDVSFGDNESIASTSLFAGDPTATGLDGRDKATLRVSRAWTEITLPVGKIRAGRMTSQWGMGLLANGGDGFDDTFGENRYGATYDRVLFATRPIAIAQKIADRPDTGIPFFLAVGVDRLVEDPLYQFYGYQCERDLREGDADFDARCDGNGDGVTDREHSWVDDTRTDDQRDADWFVDQNDDVMEMVYVAVYRGEDKPFLGANGDLTAGTYVVNRIQKETESDVWIADVYLNVKNRGVHVEFEGLTIQGTTRAIALAGAVLPGAEGDPLLKKANIFGYVARAGYEQEKWAVTMEHGFAGGDGNVADSNFSGRPLHPDHNVGLLLYEEIIARATAERWSEGAKGLWSNGGVYNSRYIFPNAHFYPMEGAEVAAAFLTAWPDKPDGAVIACDSDDDGCSGNATAKSLGWEVDVAVKHRWFDDHALFALEFGYAHATDRIPLAAVGLNPNGNFMTVQSRLAYQF